MERKFLLLLSFDEVKKMKKRFKNTQLKIVGQSDLENEIEALGSGNILQIEYLYDDIDGESQFIIEYFEIMDPDTDILS